MHISPDSPFQTGARIMDQYHGNRQQDGSGASNLGPSTFGRGWIPVERDIGLPGESGLPSRAWQPGVASPTEAPAFAGVQGVQGARYRHDGWTPARKVRFID